MSQQREPVQASWASRAAGRLGGSRLLGTSVASAQDLTAVVRQGMPVAALDALTETTLSKAELFDVVIPRRTYTHRKSRDERLSPEVTERAVRVARIAELAEETFGDPEKGRQWLRRPTTALGGKSPLSLLDTEIGAGMVEELLTRISHGIAA